MKEIKLYNSPNIKLQGLYYYNKAYKYWDLNLCSDAFEKEYDQLLPTINLGWKDPRSLHNEHFPMCVIDLDKYDNSYENYYSKLPNNIRRDVKVSKKNKFYFKEYDFNHHVIDFSSINKKKENINPWYLQDSSYFKGSHSGYRHHWENHLHFSQWYGCFKYFKHYKQEEMTTNEKLFAYCKIAYDGELATVHLILGDKDNLKHGIMSHLMTSIVKECFQNKVIKYLVYYTYAGRLVPWKERFLYEKQKIKYIL